MGGRFKRKRTFVYLWLIHADVWQKPTQYCKAIILQSKINKGKNSLRYNYFFNFFKKQAKLNTLFHHTHTQTTKNKGVINTKFRTVVICWGEGREK